MADFYSCPLPNNVNGTVNNNNNAMNNADNNTGNKNNNKINIEFRFNDKKTGEAALPQLGDLDVKISLTSLDVSDSILDTIISNEERESVVSLSLSFPSMGPYSRASSSSVSDTLYIEPCTGVTTSSDTGSCQNPIYVETHSTIASPVSEPPTYMGSCSGTTAYTASELFQNSLYTEAVSDTLRSPILVQSYSRDASSDSVTSVFNSAYIITAPSDNYQNLDRLPVPQQYRNTSIDAPSCSANQVYNGSLEDAFRRSNNYDDPIYGRADYSGVTNIHAQDSAENIRMQASISCMWGHKYKNGDGVPLSYQKAIGFYIDASRLGNAEAACSLGFMSLNGIGVSRDYVNAILWFLKAASQGDTIAQNEIGVLYFSGMGLPNNASVAMQWFQKAACQEETVLQGNPEILQENSRGYLNRCHSLIVKRQFEAMKIGIAAAQTNIGIMYTRGSGVPKDYSIAFKWYLKAANLGNSMAQSRLGVMYFKGYGTQKDFTESMRWFHESANRGDSTSQTSLGIIYSYNEIVPRDESRAMYWYHKAVDQGNASAQCRLGTIYFYGNSVVDPDYLKAADLYTKSAKQGNVVAQRNLGYMYLHGIGVRQDPGSCRELVYLADDVLQVRAP
ncbi:hypothetical protein BGX20_006675 [Mortierella sp. AD010]|nr:hypothetical protein BGX20_006675 [Mortierella sp. AD010]